MNYKITRGEMSHPLLKPILQKLNNFFNELGIQFFVIGATARDIAIPDFTKDVKQKQRFLYKKTFQIDIVPFGAIMKEADKIFWPPDEQVAMSVLGFNEVTAKLIPVTIDEDIEINIASLAGIFILKVVAWKDRHLRGNKDADDMGFILANYLNIYENVALEKYEEIYEVDDFSTLTAGAKLLGDDLSEILKVNTKTKSGLAEILKEQLSKAEESLLINQMLETNRIFKYDEITESLNIIITKLEQ